MAKKILNEESKQAIRENFKVLQDNVTLALFTAHGKNDQYNDISRELVTELADLDKRIKAEFHTIGDDLSKKLGIERSPTLMISPERYDIRFTGAPLGEEGRTLIMSILMASTHTQALSEDSLKRLGKLKEKRHVRVFVSPS